jgi:predicted secreted Zn-dependent protease
MKDSINNSEDFYAELTDWRNEMIKDIEIITEGLKIQGDPGKAYLLKFYRGMSHKILKWKQFVHETNANKLED